MRVPKMRDILFRGKFLMDGEWVFGDVLHHIDHVFIKPLDNKDGFVVDKSTVGQYTGLVDKNGNKIFEGDILASQYDDPPEGPAIEVVVWHNGAWCQKQGHYDPEPIEYDDFFLKTSKVIGNIHDNPELLEGGGH